MSTYSKADTRTQWFQDDYPGASMNLTEATMVLVVHTTEGTSWPSYSGGSTAPNYTARPDMKACHLDWRAHFPDEKSSRALVNLSGGVETNTLNSVQLELVGTCDPKHAKTWDGYTAGEDYIYWPTAPRWALNDLGAFLADLHKRHGLRLAAPTFQAYPGSYGARGATNLVRMSFAQWRSFTGVCGHQHVPENVHGDPGNIDIRVAIDHAKTLIDPPPPPAGGLPPIPLGLSILHKLPLEPYYVWGGLAGVRRAAAWGATAIDIDLLVTVDGYVVATHWPRPMRHGFVDTEKRMRSDRTIASMTMAEVRRLKTRTGYRIHTLREVLATAAEAGITVCGEAKNELRFGDRNVWVRVRNDVSVTGARFVMMSQPHGLDGLAAIGAAHAAGLPTLLLCRGRVPHELWAHLTYVKGRRAWTDPGRPPAVRRLGAGPRDATEWGASCHATRRSVAATNRSIATATRKART